MHKSLLTIGAIGSISCLLSQAGPLDRIKDRRAARSATTTTEVIKETKQAAEIITKERFKVIAKPVGKTVEIVPVPTKAKN